MVFLIEKLWTDPLENHINSAVGYDSIGYVETEEEANDIIYNGGATKGTGWPISKGSSKPNYRSTKLSKL